MPDLSTKEQIRALYNAGEEAVVTLVQGLFDKISHLEQLVESQEKRIMILEEQLKKNSRNSDKPPSSDGLRRKFTRSRTKSSRQSGGQKGHNGHTLKMVDKPDQIQKHVLDQCCHCHNPLKDTDIIAYKKRQVFDIPPLKLEVTEHQAEIKKCCHCGKTNTAQFPPGVTQSVQYGPGIKSFSVYLMQYQLIPSERTTELLEDIFSQSISEGTLYNWNRTAYQNLEYTEAVIKQQLIGSPVVHFDETGTFCQNKLNWLHVVSNSHLTYYDIHPKRGKKAMDDINVLPQYKGHAVHDFWSSYLPYECKHVICNAHLIRELTALSETLNQKWSSQMRQLLLSIKKRVEQSSSIENSFDKLTLELLEKKYDKLIQEGLRLNPIKDKKNQRRGRQKQSKATNLLVRLKEYRSSILAFMYNRRIPFTNNLAERDLRMVKVKQKISGTFRSREGACFFCRIRGFISTIKKNKLNVLESISHTFLNLQFVLKFMTE